MAVRVNIDGNDLVDLNGSPIMAMNSDNDKYYAVIAKCGHSGEGYFIPIMYPINAKDQATAIEIVKKLMSRVQRDKPNCILAAFEIDRIEYLLIERINEHDPYIKGFERKGDQENRDRRVYNELSQRYIQSRFYNKRLDDRELKTADQYSEDYVLEKTFAPRWQGDKIIPAPTNIKKDPLLREFFNRKVYRYGSRGDVATLSLYYQQYGKNNDLGVKYEPGYIQIFSKGKPRTFEVPDNIVVYLDAKYHEERKQEKIKQEFEAYSSGRNINRLSQTEKFRRRVEMHKSITRDKSSLEEIVENVEQEQDR